jgi:acyl-CoA synthetase (AMP-forming)/AMP-acid ligase II
MLLEMASDAFGDRLAIGRRSGDGLTFAELKERAGAGASVIAEAGVERVALVDTASEAFPIALYASAWAGVPFVPLNYRLSAEQLGEQLRQLAPALVIAGDAYLDVVKAAGPARVMSRTEWLEACARTDAEPPPALMDPDCEAMLLFTSGTSAAPKIAVLRHRHLTSYVLGTVEFMGAEDDEATLVCVPPYHIAGVANVVSNTYAGRRIIQLPEFTPERWLEAASTEGVTNAMVVPTMLARIVETMRADPAHAVPTLRSLAYGGSKMPLPVIEAALELFPGTGFVNAYGLTETSSTIAVLGPDDHREAVVAAGETAHARLGSVGRPVPGVEVEIRDEDGRPLPVGESGEIHVRGEQVSGEYVGRAAAVDPDGWLPTKDRGHLDADGYLYVEGRADDLIIRGGENTSPAEIEDVLLRHDAVEEAAVVGIPDVEWGERIGAVVVLRAGHSATAEELRDFVKAHLRSSKAPDVVAFRDELPYTDTGKLLRRQVRDDLIEPS